MKAPSLPVSRSESKLNERGGGGGLRRRLSSLSLKPQVAAGVSYSSWSVPRSTSMGDYARTWWAWSWAWILSRKPVFATDLEMNEQKSKLLGSHNKGTWRHVFYKLRSEIRRFITSDHATLPQTYSTPQSQPSS